MSTENATPATLFESSASWRNSLSQLSGRPRLDGFRAFLENLMRQRGADVEFVVLFGSMARGDWSRGSDFDVLVGLRRDEEERWIDRLVPFTRMAGATPIEALPYTLDEIERMFCHFNLVVLAALRDGIVLYDDGKWADYQRRYRSLIEQGLLIQEGRQGWSWSEEAERLMGGKG